MYYSLMRVSITMGVLYMAGSFMLKRQSPAVDRGTKFSNRYLLYLGGSNQRRSAPRQSTMSRRFYR